MENLTNFYYRYLRFIQAKDDSTATLHDKYMALSYAVRSQMVDKWIETQKCYHTNNPRRVYYLSMEYVFGRSLKQNIISLGLEKNALEAAENLGFSLDELYKQEDDFELGNPGKGGRAACFLEALSSCEIPSMGYGLNYDYALFQQEIKNGIQTEHPYDWIHKYHSWHIRRPEYAHTVDLNGKIGSSEDQDDKDENIWIPSESVVAVPYDFPVSGYKNDVVNTLRLWTAQSSEEFLPDYNNHGDYIRACEEKFKSGRITNYLFPEEVIHKANEMRIKQQYFFVSASLQDIFRRHKLIDPNIMDIDKKIIIQLSGCRCAMAIPEFMRLLLDKENIGWDDAWRITRNVFVYTSHEITNNNFEKLPIYLLEQIVPRHAQIIHEINRWHLDTISKEIKDDEELSSALSIVEDGEVKRVKMEPLAIIGSSCINGISHVQTEILKNQVYPKMFNIITSKIKNITNGVSIRRWLLGANKPLSGFINGLIGDSWTKNYEDIGKLETFCNDSEVLSRFEDVKHTAKRRLNNVLKESFGITFNPKALLDVNCRRIHLSKRQFLHILYILSQYIRLKNGEEIGIPRTFIFGGRAAPSDFLAKQVVHLIHIVMGIINNDPVAKNKINVIFIPNFGASIGEDVIPAADLSEQISAANSEACSTSNMKFAINGSVTIASQSGSNVEMIEKLGSENIIVFGNKSKELDSLTNYDPKEVINTNNVLQEIFAFIDEVLPSFPDGNLINPLLASIKDNDSYYVLLESEDYFNKQKRVDELYKDRKTWLSMSLRNIARSGWFSNDRAISEYSKDIWKI